MDPRYKLTDVPQFERYPPYRTQVERGHVAENARLSDEARRELASIAVSGSGTVTRRTVPPAWMELLGSGLVQVNREREPGNRMTVKPTPLGLRSCALAVQYGLLRDDPLIDNLYDILEISHPNAGSELGGLRDMHVGRKIRRRP